MNLIFDTREIDRLVRDLSSFPGRAVAAAATGLNVTGQRILKAERHEMRDVFDKPTPYTVSPHDGEDVKDSLFSSPATAKRPVATIGVKTYASGGRPPIKWLRWQIDGGLRRWTGFERALIRGGAMPDDMRGVPGRFARLDGYGNMSRGQMVQILSQLRIDTGRRGSTSVLPTIRPGDDQFDINRKSKVIRNAYNRAGQFVAFPYGRGKLLPGIYQIKQFGHGRSEPRPVFIYVFQAQYEAGRFDFQYVARKVVERFLAKDVEAELARAAFSSASERATYGGGTA